MTKKHFIALADQLKSERAHFVAHHGEKAFTAMVDFCVDFCKGQNPRFNSEIFRGLREMALVSRRPPTDHERKRGLRLQPLAEKYLRARGPDLP